MSDFARIVGLSRPTVAKYFADPTSVRSTTRRLIEDALRVHDFRPNLFAQSLKRRNPRNIGLVVPHLIDPFYAEVVRRIETTCREMGYWAIVLSSHGEPSEETAALEMLLSLNLAGAIVAPLGHKSNLDLLQKLNKRIELVVLDARIGIDAPFVGTDNDQSISMMVDYLCRTGEPPCFMDMPGVNSNAIERREAYVRAMGRADRTPTVIPVDADGWNFEAAGFAAANRQIDIGGFPTRTIMCANDRIAFGVMAAACRRGVKIGRTADSDLRVAGHDDHPLSPFSCPGLTTVAQDYTAIATTSLNLLLAAISDEGLDAGEAPCADIPEGTALFPARLIMRESA
ncbi:LacI family DNA-binding transcriptional regulator [Tropicimonas isoalkanivorans]|nr:LacI family DNA-binding transcriptional regulator [Tropicimonas isoalkanivorans]